MTLIRMAAAAPLLLASQLCFAADKTPRLDSRPVPPSAIYIGLHGGIAWAEDKISQYDKSALLFEQRMASDPAFGGLHVGFKREVDGVVVGLEADYDLGKNAKSTSYAYAPVDGNNVPTGSSALLSRTYEVNYRSTLRARVGYQFGALGVYATGGGAMTSVKMNATASNIVNFPDYKAQSSTAFGFGATLGAGVEYFITRNWAAFTEYRYADFGKVTGTSDNGALGAKSQTSHRITETSVRAGATYYFR